MKEEVSNSAHKHKASPQTPNHVHITGHTNSSAAQVSRLTSTYTPTKGQFRCLFNSSHYIGGTYPSSNQSHVASTAFAKMKGSRSQSLSYTNRNSSP